MKTRSLTQERLKEILHYQPDTGVFTWVNDAGAWGRITAGTASGTCSKIHGYIEIWCDGVLHKGHRLAWLYMTGALPKSEIDHINRIRNDNRWCNLREVTTAQNMFNKEKYKSNTSGFPGVTWHKRVKKWQARIGSGNIRRHLGYFDSAELAGTVYKDAKKQFHAFIS